MTVTLSGFCAGYQPGSSHPCVDSHPAERYFLGNMSGFLAKNTRPRSRKLPKMSGFLIRHLLLLSRVLVARTASRGFHVRWPRPDPFTSIATVLRLPRQPKTFQAVFLGPTKPSFVKAQPDDRPRRPYGRDSCRWKGSVKLYVCCRMAVQVCFKRVAHYCWCQRIG